MIGTTTKIILILLAGAILFVWNLGGVALWDPDEPRQAIMAREMMVRQDYVHPYLNGKPYLEKPPMYPWLIIAAAKLKGGLDESAARLPAALSAIGLALITFLLGKMILDGTAGLLAALIFMTNYQVLSVGRESVMDMAFAFFIGLAICCGYYAMEKKRPSYIVLSMIPAAFAVLSKGPAGLVIPAAVLFLAAAVRGNLKRCLLPLVAGSLLAGAVAAVWFLLAGEAYWKEFILRQNITRYTAAFDHRESYLYYFHKLFVNFLPWSLLLPFALWGCFRRKAWLPLLWFFFTFTFFFFSLSKRAIYLLPLYPAMALATGLYLRESWAGMVERKAVRIIILVFGALLTVLPPAFLAVGKALAARSHVVALVQAQTPFLPLYLLGFCVLGVALCFFVAAKRPRPALAALFAYLLLGGYAHHAVYLTAMDRGFKSPRLITDALTDLKGGKEIYTFGFMSPAFVYYADRPVHYLQKRLGEIKHDKRDIIIVVEEHPWSKRMRDEIEATYTPVRRLGYEKERYVIYQYLEKDGR